MVFRIDLRNTLIITLVHAHNRGITWIRAKFGRAFIWEERIPGTKETPTIEAVAVDFLQLAKCRANGRRQLNVTSRIVPGLFAIYFGDVGLSSIHAAKSVYCADIETKRKAFAPDVHGRE